MSRGYASLTQNVDYGGVAEAARFQPMRSVTTGAFWVVRMDNILELFQGVYQAGRWPVAIYPNWLQVGLTFIVPVAFAVTVPAEDITGRLTGATLLETLAVTVLLLALSRWFWRFGLKPYSGASS